jgi:hypothetical protein
MWDRLAFPLTHAPFEHVVVDDFLPRVTYDALAASFPECAPASGPTGFTIHPGDDAFEQLMQREARWHEFAAACDSQAFVDFVRRQFADVIAQDCVADLGDARHVHYRESRQDKEQPFLRRVEHPIDRLFVRFDLMQGRVGYLRERHLDHRRRLATMLVYFNDADAIGMQGGDLVLHGDGEERVTVRPRGNRAVLFPCHNRSWHSVSRIEQQRVPRNFVQVTLSSSLDLWRPLPRTIGQRLRDVARRWLRPTSRPQ